MRISDWSSDVCSSDLTEGDSSPTIPPTHPILLKGRRMSILRKAVDRLANFFRFDHKVILRFAVDRYNASYVVPLIEKLIADGEDGDTYRSALAAWNRAEQIGRASSRERVCQYV